MNSPEFKPIQATTQLLFSRSLLVLLVLAAYLASKIILPFFHTILLATVFAVMAFPLFSYLKRKLKIFNTVSALLTVFIIIVCVAFPLSYFFIKLLRQAITVADAFTRWVASGGLAQFVELMPQVEIEAWIMENIPFLDVKDFDIQTTILNASRQFGSISLWLGSNILTYAIHYSLHILIFFLTLFFMLKDGESLLAQIQYLSPLRKNQEERIIASFKKVSRAVLVGGIAVAMVQGILGSIGMGLAGFPPLFSGALMAAASFVPLFGTGLIWLPASFFLLLTGQWEWFIFLTVWGVIIVSGSDSILRPYFMKQGGGGSPVFYIFLSILGGLTTFGAAGIVYGPLILGFVTIMIDLYKEEYKDFLDKKSAKNEVAEGK